MVQFSCTCGQTTAINRPPDCKVCPNCGSKIIAVGSEEDPTPIEHHWTEKVVGEPECKRCGKKQ